MNLVLGFWDSGTAILEGRSPQLMNQKSGWGKILEHPHSHANMPAFGRQSRLLPTL